MTGARQDLDRLRGIVDEILDLSRIRTGRIEIHARPTDARALLARAVAAAQSAARAKSIALLFDPPPGELPVLADADRIDIVFANLFANAVRHTPGGGRIAVGVGREGSASVRFEVRDTGPGIPEEHCADVFERFFQVPGSKSGGLGLGLYISREIVLAHGGDMGVLPARGGGSAFWFTLPVGPAGA